MPHRLIKLSEFSAKIDFQPLFLNVTSLGALITHYVAENTPSLGVFVLIISIAALNFAKAYKTIKEAKRK